MIEIRFRAWDKKCKDMLYSDVQTEEYEFRFTENGIEVYGYLDDFTNPMNVELMQFTGLYDKHQKPIYEGDIVEVKSIFSNKNERYVVEYSEYSEWVIGMFLLSKRFQSCEVIGNIYENPELLDRSNGNCKESIGG